MVKISVVVAAYDEEKTVEALTRRLQAALSRIPACEWQIVYVVEGADATRQIVERLMAEIPGITLLYGRVPSGLGNAFRRGFAAMWRDTDLVVTMDADLNHQPEEMPRLVSALSAHAVDIVVGSRFLPASRVEGTPLWKSVLSRGVNRVMGTLYGLRVRDKTSGFRVYRRPVLDVLAFRNADFAFLPEILLLAARAGARVREEPIRFVFRREGTSKMAIFRTAISYVRLFLGMRRRPTTPAPPSPPSPDREF